MTSTCCSLAGQCPAKLYKIKLQQVGLALAVVTLISTSSPPTPSVQPSTLRPSTMGPSINNQNPTNTRIDYGSLCTKLQPVLVQSCHILVNNQNPLTSQVIMHCIV